MVKESSKFSSENVPKSTTTSSRANGFLFQEKFCSSSPSKSFLTLPYKLNNLNELDSSNRKKQSSLFPVKLSKFSKKESPFKLPESISESLNNSKQKVNGFVKTPRACVSPTKQSEITKFNGNNCANNQEQSPVKNMNTNHQLIEITKRKAQSTLYRKMFGVFKENQEVLARWSDGLYYLGSVQQVCDFEHRCYVRFEDKSMCWVHFKDLQPISKESDADNEVNDGLDSDLTCAICRDGTSEKPNEIVLCDKCGQGFHQLCHTPTIDTNILNEDEAWQCRMCVFAAAARKGGADQEGPTAVALRQMKQQLSYDLSSLTWDKGHKSNTEETYCYCGGPGDWYLKMLQCSRCFQWFHEACLQCMDSPILYGDRFFVFVCSLCNGGNEFAKRLPMRWVDVVHLVLYNITITKTNKYYEFASAIIPYFAQNWDSLRLGELVHEAPTRSKLKERVLETLQNNKSRFQCGNESKKAKMSWGLRTRSPPSPPALNVPATGVINESLFQSMDLRHGSLLLNESPTPLKRSAPGDSGAESPPRKAQCKTFPSMEWLPKTPSKVFGDVGNCVDSARDNLFERFYDISSTNDKPADEVGSSGKQEKRRPGRPRKQITAAPVPAITHTAHASSPSTAKVKKQSAVRLKKEPASFASESSSIPMSELFREIPGLKSSEPMSGVDVHDKDLRRTMARYFGAEGRIACGERFNVLAKRVVNDNVEGGGSRVEYLIEWEGYTAGQLHESVQKR